MIDCLGIDRTWSASSAPMPRRRRAGFVSRSGTQLMLDGSPFYFLGEVLVWDIANKSVFRCVLLAFRMLASPMLALWLSMVPRIGGQA